MEECRPIEGHLMGQRLSVVIIVTFYPLSEINYSNTVHISVMHNGAVKSTIIVHFENDLQDIPSF